MERIRALRIPVLVSANCLWDAKRGEFAYPRVFEGVDLALDSGGFVAMKRYGGYRWSAEQYVRLARHLRPAWWAQMDFCCEPEIASDAAAVRERIGRTVSGLQECQRIAQGEGMSAPMPVLQGWKPEDYAHGPIYEQDYRWPKLVGVGSVCRRPIDGANGIMAVVSALDQAVPSGVQFHLFGVKSQAIARLVEEFPSRIASMDSQAWSVRARKQAHLSGEPCDNERRAAAMVEWYERQVSAAQSGTPQMLLGF